VARARSAAALVTPLLATALLATPLGACANGRADTPAERRARERAEVERIRGQVATVRGLAWRGPLDVRIVSRAELRRRLGEADARDARPERDASDEALLKLLKLIPADLALKPAIERLLAQEVIGFYDAPTKRLFVAGETDGRLSADTRVTLAHELDHALTDQHFGFGAVSRFLDAVDRTEELAAYTALIEGDAVLLQSLWAQRYLDESAAGSLGAEMGEPLGRDIPRYLQHSLVFPYTQGLEFAFDRYRTTRSFSPVDAAWRRRPTSTEEILHPERYSDGQQWHPPALPDLTATGCRVLRANTLGEFDMRELLDHFLSERDATRAADHWAGDAFQFLSCGTTSGFVDRWTADDGASAGVLAAALRRWARAWSGDAPDREGWFAGRGGAGRVHRRGSSVDLVLAGDADIARRLVDGLG
jgi:hypothetical protein